VNRSQYSPSAPGTGPEGGSSFGAKTIAVVGNAGPLTQSPRFYVSACLRLIEQHAAMGTEGLGPLLSR
jgi:hypothetical protein